MNIFKKIIISLIFSIIAVLYTAQIWQLRYFPINIDIEGGKGKIRVSATLFKFDQKTRRYVHEEKHKEVYLPLRRKIKLKFTKIDKPENISFMFSKIKSHKPITVHNISLININKLSNVKNYEIKIGTLAEENGKLKLIPDYKLTFDNYNNYSHKGILKQYYFYNHNDTNELNYLGIGKIKYFKRGYLIAFNYKPKIKYWNLFKINYFALSLIIFISFIIAYFSLEKISKILKNIYNQKSKPDLIFVIIMFLLLFIPMQHINLNKISENENRGFTTYKDIYTKDKGINFNYWNDLSQWINDRFFTREQLISLNTNITCSINQFYCQSNNSFLYKKGNFMYDNSIIGLKKINENKKNILKEYAHNINELQKYCDNENIKLYFLIAPRKYDFFNYKITYKYIPDQADEIIKYLNKHTKTKIIYPQKEMQTANKQTPVYFKTDHHWTKKGAYTGYYALIQEIKKDFPDVIILNEKSLIKYYDNRVKEGFDSKFNNGNTYKRLRIPNNMASNILDTPYLYYTNPQKKDLKLIKEYSKDLKNLYDEKEDKRFEFKKGYNKSVMLIGNSFAGNLLDFLPYSFKHTVSYNDNRKKMNFEYYKRIIEIEKPDIIIINFNSANLYRINNLYNKK